MPLSNSIKVHSSRAQLLWAGWGNGFIAPCWKGLFLVYTFCMGALWSLCSVTGNLGTFLMVYWGTPSESWPEWAEFLKTWAKFAYFIIVYFRKLYSSVQVFMLYQASCCSIMERFFPSRSFHIVFPCQAQYILKHLNLFCTLRVAFALLTTAYTVQSKKDYLLKMQVVSWVDKILLRSVWRVFSERPV